jgi:hypothetical protein
LGSFTCSFFSDLSRIMQANVPNRMQ